MRILSDDFLSGGDGWTYAGVSNAMNEPLFKADATTETVRAEWSQSNLYVGAGDPQTILSSSLSRPLGRELSDHDTFRFGVTLKIATGTVANTSEMFQIGNLTLCDALAMGPDRAMSDNWSGNSQLVKDGSDFVEFNYFINNAWGGPNITAVIGAHITGVDGEYTTGTNYLQTAMGEDHWLPEGTNLYIQVEYFGAATGELARVAHAAIYTEPARTNQLVVNGVVMSYWTEALPGDKSFRVKDVAFYNYPAANWAGPNGAAAGTFDDVYVDRHFANGEVFAVGRDSADLVTAWAAESGTTYYVEFATDLKSPAWVTNAVIVASEETACWTAALNGAKGYYRVSH